jgi:exonuclease III
VKIATYNVNGIIVACLYLPNGNPQPGPKFDYKLAWFERQIQHAASLWKSGHPMVLAGDFNVDRWVRGEEHATDHAPVWVESGDRVKRGVKKAKPAIARTPD